MLTIPGYQITEEIHRGSKTTVYRGYREHDHCPLIFKTLSADYPTPQDLAYLQHEYAITQDWEENGQPRSYALLKLDNRLVLILQDIGGIAINRVLATQTLPLATFLTLALALAQALSRIHQRHLIHKDINPSNLVVNLNTGQVQIIDFGIASQLSRETPQLQSPGYLEGTLAYLSPEQTGRMNRSMDYRTDFYSLGASFYEMLTGIRPFSATDPMELVHCHLAKIARPIQELRPDIPPVVNELVAKLMAKTAEARYQSAFGLIADLETCLQSIQTSKTNHSCDSVPRIAAFTLGQHDVSERFQIPQTLYGRQIQVQQLLDAFARVAVGPAEMLLVAGYSGVGKSALVHEVHKPVTEKQGYFIAGKFDQFQRDIPYTCLIQAFQELLRQLLTESPEQIAHWKSLLQQALGVNAQVIIKVIPEVEWIIGPQASVPELPPAQALNRFNLVFQQFIRTFTTAKHPLVLFLDDLQWADLPSLQLIKLFMSAPETGYLLIIGAYRDNEVPSSHPLMLMLEQINQAASKLGHPPPTTLTLPPLNIGHVQQLLQESLHCEPEQSQTLAALCMEKTQGNPFFLGQFLHALVEAQQIRFNHVSGRWQWDSAQLQQTPMTQNVVELMAAKIQTLAANTQALIQLAACIGNQFDLDTLALAGDQSREASAQALWPALKENLVVPLDKAYKYLTNENVPGNNVHFKFVHDRVQQAAYSLIDDASKAIFHLRIARLLLAHFSAKEREERIFDLIWHWNRGQSLLTDPAEKEQLARMNLAVGKKARSSSAYTSALNYFQAGIKQLHGWRNEWEVHYDLTLALHLEACDSAYLCGDFAQMNLLAKTVLRKATSLLDQVSVYQIQMRACTVQNQSLEAIKIALPVLKRLGVRLPPKPGKLHFKRGLRDTKAALADKPVADLAALPSMTEAIPLAAMQLLSGIAPPAYFALPQLLPLISCKQVELSIKYGNTALSAYAYAVYGMILCGVVGDIEAGYRFGNLAIDTLERFSANALKTKIMHIVESFIRHWRAPLHERIPALQETWQIGLQTGDFEYATYAIGNCCNLLFFTGRELPEVRREIKKYAEAMAQFKQDQALSWQKLLEQTVLNLSGQSQPDEAPWCLLGSSYNEEITPISANNRTAMFRISFYKLMLAYLFEQYPIALEQAEAAEHHLDAVLGFSGVPICHFYMALVRLAVLQQLPTALSEEERLAMLKKVLAIQKKLHNWAEHAPMNHLHKWHLVEAELARLAGQELNAIHHYDQAITLARKNGFPQEEALANELAGRFYLSRGQEKVAKLYLQDAHYGYQHWGAQAKVRQLEEHYPEWLARSEARNDKRLLADATMRTLTVEDNTSGDLDLATVMKASQALSGEIVLGQLLEKLMRFGIENAGAQYGVLLLESHGEWLIEAEGSVNDSTIKVLQSRPLLHDTTSTTDSGQPATPGLPISLIQYVALTKKALVLDEACAQGRFISDAYIQQNQVKSVLCVPILHQTKLAGILYLENNLTQGAFTAGRLAVLKILSSQAAISIENARVYENLESTVTQRTAALSDSNAALSHAYAIAESARQQAQQAEHKATQALEHLRATQTQLIQSEKMASLGQLVAGVAHDLNTPIGNALTTASSMSDASRAFEQLLTTGAMRKSALSNFATNALNMAQVIESSCQRAAKLINSFKQVAADQTSEERRTFNLRASVEDNIAALRAGFNPDPWLIEIAIPGEIVCDSYPGPLGQVVANLVQNAVYHAFAGRATGRLSISACVSGEMGEMVEMVFADDGHGMDSQILAHIFEPFYTAHTGQAGPGLGLSIALNIVSGVLGGTLTASSVPGAGSQFVLRFPLHCAQ